MLAGYFGRLNEAKVLIASGADISAVNWKQKQRSALDYAIQESNYNLADMIRNNDGFSGLEQAKYPAKPAPRNGYTTCNTSCTNGDCYRTYADGRKVRFQAQQKYNSFSGQWEWDSGTCQ